MRPIYTLQGSSAGLLLLLLFAIYPLGQEAQPPKWAQRFWMICCIAAISAAVIGENLKRETSQKRHIWDTPLACPRFATGPTSMETEHECHP